MEEDIKILEEHIKELEEEKVLYGGFLSRKQAIENLLKAYKEDEAVIEEMAKKLNQSYFDENRFWSWFEDKIVEKENGKFKYGCLTDRINKIKEYFKNKVKELRME